MNPEQVHAEVTTSNILGRGGAGFEAGKKWSMMRKAPVRYLVVNGDESEPCTFKDHLLVEGDPNQLVEGTIIAAYAIGAALAIIYVRGEMALGLERVQQAVNDAYRQGALGKDIFGSGFSLDIVVHPGAGAYICGEETALLESLEGRAGMPRIKPPYFPAAIGLYGEPTIVNNVETISNLPWIVKNGGAAFAALGGGRSTGTRLFALSGHVNRPGTYEVEMVKVTFRDLIFDPAARRRHPRRSSGEGDRPRRRVGAVVRARSTSISRSARTRSPRPRESSPAAADRCSARDRSSSWTRPPTS